MSVSESALFYLSDDNFNKCSPIALKFPGIHYVRTQGLSFFELVGVFFSTKAEVSNFSGQGNRSYHVKG